MINNINLLLLVTYIDQVYASDKIPDEQSYQLFQLEHSISRDDYNLANVLREYIEGNDAQMQAISVSAHRWLWQKILESDRVTPDADTEKWYDKIVAIYLDIPDPIVRYDIAQYLFQSEQETQITRLKDVFVSGNILTDDLNSESRIDLVQLEELVDILLDLQIELEDFEGANELLHGWLLDNAEMQSQLRSLLSYRIGFFEGSESGQRIIRLLDLDNSDDRSS